MKTFTDDELIRYLRDLHFDIATAAADRLENLKIGYEKMTQRYGDYGYDRRPRYDSYGQFDGYYP